MTVARTLLGLAPPVGDGGGIARPLWPGGVMSVSSRFLLQPEGTVREEVSAQGVYTCRVSRVTCHVSHVCDCLPACLCACVFASVFVFLCVSEVDHCCSWLFSKTH